MSKNECGNLASNLEFHSCTFSFSRHWRISTVHSIFKYKQELPSKSVLKNSCSQTFCKISLKIPVWEQRYYLRLELNSCKTEDTPYLSVFSPNAEKCGPESISPYSVQMRENADQNISEYGHFLCSEEQLSWRPLVNNCYWKN